MTNIPFLEDVMYVILLLFFITGIIILWRLNRNPNNPLYLTDLISVDGKINERKLSRFGAWVVSTWGFVYLIIDDNLSEWYFIGYMGAWVANALIGKAIGSKDPYKQHYTQPRNQQYQQPYADFQPTHDEHYYEHQTYTQHTQDPKQYTPR